MVLADDVVIEGALRGSPSESEYRCAIFVSDDLFFLRRRWRGGSVSPLEEFAVEILDLIAQRPDPDLSGQKRLQNCASDGSKRQPQLALAFSRPTQHHRSKGCCRQPNGSEQMWRERAAAGYESKASQRVLARLVFIDETAVSTNMVRLRGEPRVASG